MSAPSSIPIPAPPSDPNTPSEFGPGTPNSTITSVSTLSTVANKDGHPGTTAHHTALPQQRGAPISNQTLDAEQADRISRLAGLDSIGRNYLRDKPPSSAAASAGSTPAGPPTGYFESMNSTPPVRDPRTLQPGFPHGTANSRGPSGMSTGNRFNEIDDVEIGSSAGASTRGRNSENVSVVDDSDVATPPAAVADDPMDGTTAR